jgi:hypothetical protein
MTRFRLFVVATVACLPLSLSPRATAISEEPGGVRNWTAPPYWTPPAEAVTSEPSGREALSTGRQPLAIGPVVMPFVAVAPCRVADTRAGSGFTGAYGPPSLAASETRAYTIVGKCNIPADAQAVSFNFTVWGTASYGNLTVYPAGGSVPTVSTLNWPPGTLALANAAIVPLGSGGSAGQIAVANQSTSAIDVFIDVNGYYSPLGVVNTVNGMSGNVSIPSLPPSGAAGGALTGTYPSPTIAAGAVGANNIASGQVVKSVNGLTDTVTLTAGAGIGVSGTTISSLSSGTYYKSISAITCQAQGAPTGDTNSCSGGGMLRTDGDNNFPCIVRSRAGSVRDTFVCELDLPSGAILKEVRAYGSDNAADGYMEAAVWRTAVGTFGPSPVGPNLAWFSTGVAAAPGLTSFTIFATTDPPHTIDGTYRYQIGFALKSGGTATVYALGFRAQYTIP